MENASQNRSLTRNQVLASGLCAGLICFFLAESLCLYMNATATIAQHDQRLAALIGLLYMPLSGIWLGWRQRSWRRGSVGAGFGILLAFAYILLCQTKQFFLIMVGFPTLLGAGLAMLAGSNNSSWSQRLILRGRRGALAGITAGAIYAFVLNVLAFSILGFCYHAAPEYIRMMWQAGPVAFGLASAAFFLLISRAVELDVSDRAESKL